MGKGGKIRLEGIASDLYVLAKKKKKRRNSATKTRQQTWAKRKEGKGEHVLVANVSGKKGGPNGPRGPH